MTLGMDRAILISIFFAASIITGYVVDFNFSLYLLIGLAAYLSGILLKENVLFFALIFPFVFTRITEVVSGFLLIMVVSCMRLVNMELKLVHLIG